MSGSPTWPQPRDHEARPGCRNARPVGRLLQAVQSRDGEPDGETRSRPAGRPPHTTNLSVGCYCEQEARCHRSVLRTLLADCGALLR